MRDREPCGGEKKENSDWSGLRSLQASTNCACVIVCKNCLCVLWGTNRTLDLRSMKGSTSWLQTPARIKKSSLCWNFFSVIVGQKESGWVGPYILKTVRGMLLIKFFYQNPSTLRIGFLGNHSAFQLFMN